MRKNSSQRGLAVPPIDTVSGFSMNADGGMVIADSAMMQHDLEQLPLYEQAAQTLKFHQAKMVEGELPMDIAKFNQRMSKFLGLALG